MSAVWRLTVPQVEDVAVRHFLEDLREALIGIEKEVEEVRAQLRGMDADIEGLSAAWDETRRPAERFSELVRTLREWADST